MKKPKPGRARRQRRQDHLVRKIETNTGRMVRDLRRVAAWRAAAAYRARRVES